MNDTPLWLLGTVLASLLVLSAFFSGSETGMMSLNRYRLRHMARKHAGARRAKRLLDRPDRLIGVILIGNNAVNILASIIAGIICTRLFGPEIGIAVATVALTLVVLIFSEVTPKTIAALYPEKIAFAASHILKPLLKLLYPLVVVVNYLSNVLVRLLGFHPNPRRDDSLTREELRSVVFESTGKTISEDHQDMLVSILDLETVSVNDIMVPKNEVYGLDLEDDLDVLLDRIIASEHTRLPVYDGDINQTLGFLHLRHMSRLLRGGAITLTKEAIKRFTREPYFVPEGTPLSTQLINFRKHRHRLAMVVDEYGDIAGLVTLEDLLEEIVGEFTTNLIDDEDEIKTQPDGSFLIDGSATVRDINKATAWDLPQDGPKTLNGLVLEALERIPEGSVSVELKPYRFETITLKGNVIERIKVWRLGPLEAVED
ncbi:MAG: HlyC/CorC family transporter [Porticoccaceae bacterium]